MWHIILQILAVIGIVILCILGLLLLVVAVLLFVPVRYRVEGCRADQTTALSIRASWLCHLVSFRYRKPGENPYSVRILGIPIPIFRKGKAEAGKEEAEAGKEEAEAGKAEPETEERTSESTAEKTEPALPQKQKSRRSPLERLRDKIKKCIYTIRSACDKIKNIVKNISYYKEVLTAEENRSLYERLLGRLEKVLKSIFPKRLRARLLVGTGSPDTTGYLCALYGMLLPFCGKRRELRFAPDFEKKCFEGSFFLKGRVLLFPLVVQACGVFCDKQLRRFLKQLKQEEK